jgi:hypothetical protein
VSSLGVDDHLQHVDLLLQTPALLIAIDDSLAHSSPLRLQLRAKGGATRSALQFSSAGADGRCFEIVLDFCIATVRRIRTRVKQWKD